MSINLPQVTPLPTAAPEPGALQDLTPSSWRTRDGMKTPDTRRLDRCTMPALLRRPCLGTIIDSSCNAVRTVAVWLPARLPELVQLRRVSMNSTRIQATRGPSSQLPLLDFSNPRRRCLQIADYSRQILILSPPPVERRQGESRANAHTMTVCRELYPREVSGPAVHSRPSFAVKCNFKKPPQASFNTPGRQPRSMLRRRIRNCN